MFLLEHQEARFEVSLYMFFCAAELKKQRDFYQKLGMEVPGDIKGELCNMKAHLDSQRNGMFYPHFLCHKWYEAKVTGELQYD